jgi:hypothetical protein
MRRIRSTRRVKNRKNLTRRSHRGGFFGFTTSPAPTPTQETAPTQETNPTQETKTEPTMNMKQRISGFTTLGNAAYVANRMEDKMDFLLVHAGLDDARKNIDAYWKRSQQGYFAKKN